MAVEQERDVVVVGAGFGGLYMTNRYEDSALLASNLWTDGSQVQRRRLSCCVLGKGATAWRCMALELCE